MKVLPPRPSTNSRWLRASLAFTMLCLLGGCYNVPGYTRYVPEEQCVELYRWRIPDWGRMPGCGTRTEDIVYWSIDPDGYCWRHANCRLPVEWIDQGWSYADENDPLCGGLETWERCDEQGVVR